MSQKSIAIYSLFGPQATKVNNTVTSSLPSEHGHKTVLLLYNNPTELFIYAGIADYIGFHKGKACKTARQRGQVPVLSNQSDCWDGIKRKAWYLSYLSFTYVDFIGGGGSTLEFCFPMQQKGNPSRTKFKDRLEPQTFAKSKGIS